jgi:hypothetical protein
MKPLLGVAVASLRSYWGSAAVILALGGAGLATLAPIRSLGSRNAAAEPLLRLPPIPAAQAVVPASPESLEPSMLQARALGELYVLLLILGWAALVIAGISILTRFSAQAATRGPEVGVRRAAGASRRDLILSHVGEGGILFVGVLALGLPVSVLLLRAFVADWPGGVIGASLVPWAATVVLFATLLVGALTPLRFAVTRSIKDDADGQVLLGIPAFQLAMSLALLMGSGVLLQRGRGVEREAAGPSAGSAQVYRLTSHTTDPAARSSELGAMLDSLQSAPGIAAVSLASPGTAVGLGRVDHATTDCGQCVLGQIPMRYWLVTAGHHLVSEHTFTTQGIRVLEGRAFSPADGWDAPRVALVNRHLALTAFERAGAVGRDLYLADDWPKRPYRVIGIVEDVRSPALGGALQPLDTIYLSVLQHPARELELSARVSDSAHRISELPAFSSYRPTFAGSSRNIFAEAAAPVAWFGRRFTLVGLVVLLAALAGTFGTMRMWVWSMAAELAARRAVGASRPRIIAWVLRHTIGTGTKGVLAGLFLYFAVLRVSLTNLVGDIPAWDPLLFGVLAGVLVSTAVLGAVLPSITLLKKPIAQLFN